MRFRSTRRGITADVDPVEAQVLASCAADLLVLLDDDPDPTHPHGADDDPDPDDPDPDGPEPAPVARPAPDPLEALVGLTSAPAGPPDDPALQRLLPDAYADDDPEASREFRRYTEGDLRAGKRANAGVVLATLPHGGGRLVLDPEQADAWLGCLNDLRLVLGTRLEVTEETDLDGLDDDDPRAPALQLYGWLGWVQESLISCLTPRR